MPPKFGVEFVRTALDHIAEFSTRAENIILDGISNNLSYQPEMETRHRKPLRPNSLAPWELRLGKFRVFYDIDKDAHAVLILAVGVKKGNKLLIAGQEVILEND